MVEDKNLEAFKQDFTEGYINPHLDDLLDLKNALKNATTINEVRALMNGYRASMLKELGLEEVPKEVKSERKATKRTNTHED